MIFTAAFLAEMMSLMVVMVHGFWAIGMTAAVWTGAVTGAVIKLICPRRIERVSTVAYLALGWIILVGMRPLLKLGRR
jgi:hemolysin III